MKKKILISIILVLVIIAGVTGFWQWKQIEQQRQIKHVQNQQQAIQNNNTNQNDLVWYEIPELGIKFKIEKDIADELIYEYTGEAIPTGINGKPESKVRTIYFSTKKLTSIDPKNCAAKDGPIGLISRYEGGADTHYATKDKNIGIRQLENFVISYAGPQAVCFSRKNAENPSNMQLLTEANKKYGKFFYSEEFLKSIESIK